LNKVALIVGCAPCWEDDLNRFKTICSEFDVFAIGLDCPYKEEIKYFVTYHIEDIEAYKRKRTGDYKIISHTNDFIKYSRERRKKPEWANTNVDIVYPHQAPSGSSSLLGTKAALFKLGYNKVVLIGCPMDTGNLLNKKKSYSVFQKGWLYFKSDLIGKVKSMSGWTRELLGEPTKEWIKG
jgi:hypothetical protein